MRSTRFRLLVLALAATFVVGGTTFAAAAPKAGTYVGDLTDIACGAGWEGADGKVVFGSGKDHTTDCLIAYASSGFGVLIKNGDQRIVHKFDAAGSDLALKQIIAMTKKDKNITVSVEGTLDNGILKVKSIKEVM